MTAIKTWTAISYNWSIGNTQINVFNGPLDASVAKGQFQKAYPGECLMALISGDHGTSSTSFPLTHPSYEDQDFEDISEDN
jgi:hypothetical protein